VTSSWSFILQELPIFSQDFTAGNFTVDAGRKKMETILRSSDALMCIDKAILVFPEDSNIYKQHRENAI